MAGLRIVAINIGLVKTQSAWQHAPSAHMVWAQKLCVAAQQDQQ